MCLQFPLIAHDWRSHATTYSMLRYRNQMLLCGELWDPEVPNEGREKNLSIEFDLPQVVVGASHSGRDRIGLVDTGHERIELLVWNLGGFS